MEHDEWNHMTNASFKQAVRQSFEDFVGKRADTEDPKFAARMASEGKWIGRLLRPLSLLPLNRFFTGGRRYVFFTNRYRQLLASFGRNEIAVVGGPGDFLSSLRNGLPFCFSGDLYLASQSVIFDRRFVPVDAIIDRWMRFFARQQDPCYLVVPNDTMPMALLLVSIARRCRNVRVVCIQHGLLSVGPVYQFDDVEGRNSHINLVYSHGQRGEMERRLPGRIVEVMGYPADYPPKGEAGSGLRNVLLVGTGTFDDLTNYQRALDIFHRVADIAKGVGLRSEYRPHPSEARFADLNAIRAPLNRQGKAELLGRPRMLFIGFASTLLLEAHLAGHAVILLNDEKLPAYPIGDFGVRLDSGELDKLPELIAQLARNDIAANGTDGVRRRFDHALARAVTRFEASQSHGSTDTA